MKVKCPYKHRDTLLENAMQQDNKFHLAFCHISNQPRLKRYHDYYYQVVGQLAITHAAFCDFVTWTGRDISIERIYTDIDLWPNMVDKLTGFYRDCLGPEILCRLCMM